MINFVYTKEPGLLLDALFLLKLYFNGEEAYKEFRNDRYFEEQDIAYYEMMKNKISDVNETLLPFFYYRADDDKGTPLLSYLQLHWESVINTGDSVIDGFYAILRDYSGFKRFVFTLLFPELNEGSEYSDEVLLDTVLKSSYPNDFKVYLLTFMHSPETVAEALIAQIDSALRISETIHAQYEADILCKFQASDNALIRDVHSAFFPDTEEKKTCLYTVCCVALKTVSQRTLNDSFLFYVGISYRDFSAAPEFEINLLELAQCLNDTQRIKIIEMLRKKEMYCAEIAKELGLKNNSVIYHLMMMKKCGLLMPRYCGKKVLYHLNTKYLLQLNNLINTLILEGSVYDNDVGNTEN